MKANMAKRTLLKVLVVLIIAVLAGVFFYARYHYIHSAKMDDDDGLKTLVAESFSAINPGKEIVEYRNIYKSIAYKRIAVQFVAQGKLGSSNDDEEGWYFYLVPDSLFKNRYHVGGYGGGEFFNELVADSQTYYDSKQKKIWNWYQLKVCA
ncbi:MAG: hypothetical protein Q3985_03630 [Eubacteriales bacterium]|nr:hypothetical protein [Eubacteriales bacterium]